MLVKIIKKILKELYCKGYDFKSLMKDVFDISLMKKHTKVIAESGEVSHSSTHPDKIAIITVYPSEESLIFTLNLLRALRENGFYTLVVSNAVLDQREVKKILSCSNRLMQRLNTGWDFGAWQHGLHWLDNQSILNKANVLLLANDSLFYPENIKNIIAEMLNINEPWQCLFDSHQIEYHAQSPFQLFRKEVFASGAFQTFWAQYYPRTSRRHAIHAGEVRLSVMLRQAGFMPKALYTATGLLSETEKRLMAAGYDQNDSLVQFLFDFYDQFPLQNLSHFQLRCYMQQIMNHIDKRMRISNPAHEVGLHVSFMFHAPLKRDLYYRGSCGMARIIKYAGGFDADEKIAMEKDMKRKGIENCSDPQSVRDIFRKVLLSKGYQ